MDEKQRQALETTLTQALIERQQIDATIAYLTAKLGRSAPPGMAAARDGLQSATTTSSAADPSSLVTDGEFFGLSGTKASKAVLERVGRPRALLTDEIFAAINKGGAKISGRATLYKVLDRDKTTFQKVGRGRWGLRAWYPGARVRAGGGADNVDEGEAEEATG